MALEQEAGEAAEATVRVPSNIMGLLRQSYSNREKMLDWMLAIGCALALCWAYRDTLLGLAAPPTDPNTGRPTMVPNQNTPGAFPNTARQPRFYSYNLPPSRKIAYAIGPSGTMPPANPSQPPRYEQENC